MRISDWSSDVCSSDLSILGVGGWRRTDHSPTRSGPEGSSRNEIPVRVTVPISHPTDRRAEAGRKSRSGCLPAPRIASMSDATSEREADSLPRDGLYRVLARKYRPSTFADLVGQEALVRTLTNAIDKIGRAHV